FRPILKQNFYPFQNICIDESLLLFKGRLSFKQFIPPKCNRFGIKSFVACDCTGYILDMIVYSGSKTEISVSDENLSKSGNIAMTLMKDYLGKGRSLFVNNWYTKTKACDTVKKNRKYIPSIQNKLQRREISFQSIESLLCMKWQDKREIWMLTSFHYTDMVDTQKVNYRTKLPTQKPTCVQECNCFMGIVDKTDMVISTLESIRKNVSILNSYVLYKYVSSKERFAEFHLKLIKQMFGKYLQTSNIYQGKKNSDNSLRIFQLNILIRLRKEKIKRKSVCTKHKIRRESRYHCKECEVDLCVDPYFRIYHTQINY
ncbi:hypothetical protein E2986_12625, partial [Frieseomelitta varia]